MNLNLSYLFPEWVASGFLMILILGEIFRKHTPSSKSVYLWPSLIGAAAVFLSVLPYSAKIGAAFNGMFILDPFASFFKAFFSLILLGIVFLSGTFFRSTNQRVREFTLLLWTTLIGLFFLVSANDFLILFISLEIITLSFYVMTAYLKNESIAIEAGLKYLILGSVASAFIIFGIALIYVSVGSSSFNEIRIAFQSQPNNRLTLLGFLFVLSGLGFKIASVPFQLWVPDVYQGSPTPVVAFLAVGSKSAGIAILLRLLFSVFGPFDQARILLFSILAVMTLLYGNLGALLQTNIKRLFGYSSIGHAGYLLMGIAAGGRDGVSAVLYYLLAYAVTNLLAFLVIILVGNATGDDSITSYRGLAKRSPLLAACFFIALLSLAGVPPFAGFFGKFLVLLSAVKSGLNWLALIGALGVAVSLYYYLSIVRVMYFEDSSRQEPIKTSPVTGGVLIILMLGILLLGIWQEPFLYLCRQAVSSLF